MEEFFILISIKNFQKMEAEEEEKKKGRRKLRGSAPNFLIFSFGPNNSLLVNVTKGLNQNKIRNFRGPFMNFLSLRSSIETSPNFEAFLASVF